MVLRARILIHAHPSELVLDVGSSSPCRFFPQGRNLLAHLAVRQLRLARLFPIVYFS
jgi:hypothetical protein